MGGKYQQKPNLADVARRRGQFISDVLKEWGFDVFTHLEGGGTIDEINASLKKRCQAEGIQPIEFGPPAVTSTVKNALVQLPSKETVDNAGKKRRKGKVVTHDDTATSGEHDGVDPNLSDRPESAP